MATPPIPVVVLSWGDQTPVTLDWTEEEIPSADFGELDDDNPDQDIWLVAR
jgi:hypothetical protein